MNRFAKFVLVFTEICLQIEIFEQLNVKNQPHEMENKKLRKIKCNSHRYLLKDV